MTVLSFVGIWIVVYFVTLGLLNYSRIKQETVQREASMDIEMQKVITHIETKVIKFEPRKPK